jgi:hypothetical protein
MVPKYTLEQKIADFESAVREQIFDAADALLKAPSSYRSAALRLLVSYFEPIAKYYAGFDRPGASKKYFVQGCEDVLERQPRSRRRQHLEPTPAQFEGFYEVVRCGLAHGAARSFKVVLTYGPYAFSIATSGSAMAINPDRLVKLLRDDLEAYLTIVRDAAKTTERQRFEARWDFEAS